MLVGTYFSCKRPRAGMIETASAGKWNARTGDVGTHLVFFGFFWHSTVRVDIAEIHFSTSSQHSIGFTENLLLVWTQIYDTVGDDEVDGPVSYASLVKVLDMTIQEPHVGCFVTQRH